MSRTEFWKRKHKSELQSLLKLFVLSIGVTAPFNSLEDWVVTKQFLFNLFTSNPPQGTPKGIYSEWLKLSGQDVSKLMSLFVTNSFLSNDIFDINTTLCVGTGATYGLTMQGPKSSTAMVLLSFARIIPASSPGEVKFVFK